MTISQIGSSSGDYYDILTSPFYVKRVSINSYTPFNEPKPADGQTFSKNSFPRVKSTYSSRLHVKTHNVGVIDLSSSSADLVTDLITKGYSATNALDISKAINAYGFNALSSNGVTTMSNNVYEA